MVVLVGILFKVKVVNIVESLTGLKESCTVCWRESKLVRVRAEGVVGGLVTGIEGVVVGLVTGLDVVLILLTCLALDDAGNCGLAVGTLAVLKDIVLFLD